MLPNTKDILYVVHERTLWPIVKGAGWKTWLKAVKRKPEFNPRSSGVRWVLGHAGNQFITELVCAWHGIDPAAYHRGVVPADSVAAAIEALGDGQGPRFKVVAVVANREDGLEITKRWPPLGEVEVVVCLAQAFVDGTVRNQRR